MAKGTEMLYINYYVSGTTACQPEVAPVKKKAVLPKQHRKKKILVYVDPMAIMGICVALVMFVLMIAGAVQLHSAQQRAQQMSDYLNTLQQTNVQLRETYEQGYDAEEIRKIAEAQGLVPMDQVQQVTVELAVPEQEQAPTAWESFVTFLAGLFA